MQTFMKRLRLPLFMVFLMALSFVGNVSFLPIHKVSAATPTPSMTKKIVAGNFFTLALKSDGTVWGWGSNSNGLLAYGENRWWNSSPIQAVELTNVVDVAAGQSHALAVKDDGTVWSWGYNSTYQLGYEAYSESYATQVPHLPKIVAVDAGGNHSLALAADGTVWAWGSNYKGQLGNGSTVNAMTPVTVSGLQDVVKISAGGDDQNGVSLALKNDGTVWAWGYGASGQLGLRTTANQTTAVQIPNLTDVKEISVGRLHTLALKNDGTVWTWGSNTVGQLGTNSPTSTIASSPVQVPGLADITAIDAHGDHSLAIRNDGTVWSWGLNDASQLGDGTTVNQMQPVQAQGVTGATLIAAGIDHSVVAKADGSVCSWGGNNQGDLGDGTTTKRTSCTQTWGFLMEPTLSATATSPTTADLAFAGDGNTATYTVKRGGTMLVKNVTSTSFTDQGLTPNKQYSYTVEAYDSGNHLLGNKTVLVTTPEFDLTATAFAVSATSVALHYQLDQSTAVAKYVVLRGGASVYVGSQANFTDTGLTANTTYDYQIRAYDTNDELLGETTLSAKTSMIQKVEAGTTYSLALKADGTVWGWGENTQGNLGYGDNFLKKSPVQAKNLSDVIDISAGNNYSMALKQDGTVWYWGTGLGGTGTNIPVQMPVLANIRKIANGTNDAFAITQDGQVYAWGLNNYGQLGLGNTTLQATPTLIPGLTDVVAISGSGQDKDYQMYDHTFALKADGTVWAWGWNKNNLLGTGSTVHPLVTPTLVPGLTDVVAIAAGSTHTLALKADGTVWAWGENKYGQLGEGSMATQTTPQQVKNLIDVVAIASSGQHSLAIKRDGTVWAWGLNELGELGDLTALTRYTPVRVGSVLTNSVSISTGKSHSLAMKGDGTICAWGSNEEGQIGDGTSTNRYGCTTVPGFTETISLSAVPVDPISIQLSFQYSGKGTVATYRLTRDGTIVYSGVNMSDTDTKLSPNTTYQYQIEALDANGKSLGVRTATVATPMIALDATATSNSPTVIDVAWQGTGVGSEVIAMYVLKREGTKVYGGTDLSYSDLNLQPNTLYSYSVEAYDANGNLIGTKSVSATTPAQPVVVVDLQAAAKDPLTIDLSYSVSGSGAGLVDHYILKRDGNVVYQGNGTNFTDGGQPKTSYSYTVEAYDANGNLLASTGCAVTTPAFLLEVSAQVNVPHAVDLSFQANAPVDHYVLMRDGNDLATVAANGYQDTGLAASTTYTYTVDAYDGNGMLLGSVQVTATTAFELLFDVTAVGASAAHLAYQGSGVVSKYVVTRDGIVIDQGTNTSWDDTGLKPNTAYVYVVNAYDANGNLLGMQSKSVQTDPFDLLLSATVVSTKLVDLSFTANGDVAQYVLLRDGLEVYRGSNPSFQDSGLNKNKTYTYTVNAYDATGTLLGSDVLAVNTSFTLTITAVPQDTTSIEVAWSSSGQAVAYYVVKRDGHVVVYQGSDLSLLDMNLSPSSKHHYTVEAYDANGKLMGRTSVNTSTL